MGFVISHCQKNNYYLFFKESSKIQFGNEFLKHKNRLPTSPNIERSVVKKKIEKNRRQIARTLNRKCQPLQGNFLKQILRMISGA